MTRTTKTQTSEDPRSGPGTPARAWQRRLAAAGVAAATLMAPAAAHATAPDDRGVVSQETRQEAYLFYDSGAQLLVLEGLTLEEGCLPNFYEYFPERESMQVESPGGPAIVRLTASGPAFVFDMGSYEDPFAFIMGEICPALAAGTPVTPLAEGTTTTHDVRVYSPDRPVRGRNSIHGTLTTPDGQQVRLSGSGFWDAPLGSDHIVLSN